MTTQAIPSLSRNWLMGFRTDLVWIILSAAIGWAYLALILGVGSGLENPIRDSFATLRIGDSALPLSLGLVVVASWAIVLDAPHLFATLARTVLDPEEWRVRGGVLLASFGFFLLGPALILAPRWLSSAGVLPAEAVTLGSVVFLVFFRLWAYYHVVRQHWGFLRLYARRNPAAEDEREARLDRVVFPILFYLPIGWFVTAPWYAASGMPELGFATEIGGRTLGAWLHAPVGSLWLLTVVAYAAFPVAALPAGNPPEPPQAAPSRRHGAAPRRGLFGAAAGALRGAPGDRRAQPPVPALCLGLRAAPLPVGTKSGRLLLPQPGALFRARARVHPRLPTGVRWWLP